MRIIEDTKLDFSDVLIVPKRSSLGSRGDVELIKCYTFLNSKKVYEGVPLISANMDHTGTIEMANTLTRYEAGTALHKHYSEEDLVEHYNKAFSNHSFYSMGIGDDDYEKFKNVYNHQVGDVLNKVCIDVANGYSEPFAEFVTKVRNDYPDLIIMAGNVVTPEMTEHLLLSGADIVKIGIGSGSVCTTRKLTGIGYPQLSAIIECADAAHGLNGHVCADGGCQVTGDVAKAFGAGADFVMLGGMLAGHEQCGGELVYGNSKTTVTEWGVTEVKGSPTHMKFYGMSSKAAMEKYNGGVANYRASEGKEVFVPYRGNVENTITEILGGLRSACTYTGSTTLKELPKRTTFIKVNQTHNKVFGDEK